MAGPEHEGAPHRAVTHARARSTSSHLDEDELSPTIERAATFPPISRSIRRVPTPPIPARNPHRPEPRLKVAPKQPTVVLTSHAVKPHCVQLESVGEEGEERKTHDGRHPRLDSSERENTGEVPQAFRKKRGRRPEASKRHHERGHHPGTGVPEGIRHSRRMRGPASLEQETLQSPLRTPSYRPNPDALPRISPYTHRMSPNLPVNDEGLITHQDSTVYGEDNEDFSFPLYVRPPLPLFFAELTCGSSTIVPRPNPTRDMVSRNREHSSCEIA